MGLSTKQKLVLIQKTKRVRELAAEGKKVGEIASILKCHRDSVRKVLEKSDRAS